MTPKDDISQKLDCPAPNGDRYSYLQRQTSDDTGWDTEISYFFALDLHQCVGILPRLVGSIVEAIRFLGPHKCALSIVEGRSDDGTFEVLKMLREEVEVMGAKYYFQTNEINPQATKGIGRIAALAQLRNQALQPLLARADEQASNVTVIFLNDVAVCTEDILELVHQRFKQGADMTCAMDWTYVGPDPTFYDVWISRGMNGDSFFEIPADGNWDSAWNLFWNNAKARERHQLGHPFQVFSCWNGAVAFTAKPLIEQQLRFRSSRPNECYQGEPMIFCKELWHLGYGKIAVVPSVNLEYSDEAARKIKDAKGYVSRWVGRQQEIADIALIKWEATPPAQIKCMPSYGNQTWVSWDEQL